MMKKSINLVDFDQRGWPAASELEAYFLTPEGRRTAFETGYDSWGVMANGVDGTDHLEKGSGRVDVNLNIIGSPRHGVMLNYQKWDRGIQEDLYSKGDLSRLLRWTETIHGDVWPIGLFIPFEEAWKAIREFMEKGSALPTSITWISSEDIPQEAFPDPVRGIPTE
jgi:hypothetical protein